MLTQGVKVDGKYSQRRMITRIFVLGVIFFSIWIFATMPEQRMEVLLIWVSGATGFKVMTLFNSNKDKSLSNPNTGAQ